MRRVCLYSLAAALIGLACEGSTDTTDAAAGGGVDAAGGGGVDAAMGGNPDATTGSGIDAGGGSEGACLNPADEAILDTGAVDGATTDCGNGCVFDSTPNCVRDCLVTATGLSEECAACYDGLVNCMIANCAIQCIDSESADCETCRLDNCATPFTECSGL